MRMTWELRIEFHLILLIEKRHNSFDCLYHITIEEFYFVVIVKF